MAQCVLSATTGPSRISHIPVTHARWLALLGHRDRIIITYSVDPSHFAHTLFPYENVYQICNYYSYRSSCCAWHRVVLRFGRALYPSVLDLLWFLARLPISMVSHWIPPRI